MMSPPAPATGSPQAAGGGSAQASAAAEAIASGLGQGGATATATAQAVAQAFGQNSQATAQATAQALSKANAAGESARMVSLLDQYRAAHCSQWMAGWGPAAILHSYCVVAQCGRLVAALGQLAVAVDCCHWQAPHRCAM